MKKFVSLFLVAVLCIAVLPMQAFAIRGGHVCTYSTWTSYDYTPLSDAWHLVNVVKHYKCTVCSIEYSEVTGQYYEAHHNTMIVTDENYHSGTKHFCYYVPKCLSCKHKSYNGGEWRSFACPGGNGRPCIIPRSLPLIHETR